jgi:hypothetical protein
MRAKGSYDVQRTGQRWTGDTFFHGLLRAAEPVSAVSSSTSEVSELAPGLPCQAPSWLAHGVEGAKEKNESDVCLAESREPLNKEHTYLFF